MEIIQRLYPEEDANYYLKLVKKLPLSFDEPIVTWPSIHQNHVNSKKRNYDKWNELGAKLDEAGLIDILPKVKAKRNFN